MGVVERLSLGLLLWIGMMPLACGQCDSVYMETDPFDSSFIATVPHFNVGYMVPSNFQTIDGYKMVEEGKIQFSYASLDSVGGIYMSLFLAERNFLTIQEGMGNVMFLLESGKVVSLYNIPDKGEFDKSTNMRVYHHTVLIPLDLFYLMTIDPVDKIRVYYDKGAKRTIEITPLQQKPFDEALQCLGNAVGLFKKKP